MKRKIELAVGKLIAGIAISAMLFQVGYAQETNPNPNQDQNQTQDQSSTMQNRDDLTQRTQEDLLKRYPDMNQQSVQWDTAGNEYSASYNMNDTEYRTRYDAEGNWLETMQKREWDDNNAPDNLKTGLSDNAYENYQVDSYWEITESDPNMGRDKGYFFYLKDKEGNTKNVRMDSQGKIIDENDYNDPR
jgi:hypothetical protein